MTFAAAGLQFHYPQGIVGKAARDDGRCLSGQHHSEEEEEETDIDGEKDEETCRSYNTEGERLKRRIE